MHRSVLGVLSMLLVGCGGGGSGGGGPNIGGGGAFGINDRPALANFTLPNQGGGGGAFSLEEPFPNLPNFDKPVFLTAVPLPDTRLLVVEQTGRVRVFVPSAGVNATNVILDVSSLITTVGTEQGLVGFSFDPNFNTNHFIYVFYTRGSDNADVVARYTWDPGTATANSPKIILTVNHSGSLTHNGGMMAFGPDGYLYISLGDGGGNDDPFNNGQNLSSLLGKILRIDVHPANPANAYDVPNDNPFIGMAPARPETWAFGFRNPFRFSFDRQTGQLLVGDVGQTAWEEIDVVAGGENFGWAKFEGNHLNPNRPDVQLAPGTQHTPPIHEHDHSQGLAIIGGYVYRGSKFASLFGKYVYTDYGSGTVWSIDTNGQNNTVLTNTTSPTSFGEDNDGELYVVSQAGGLFNFQEAGGGNGQPTLLSQTGLFTNLTDLTPASGLIEYDLNLPFWSDGAIKRRWIGIPQNAKVTFSPASGWVFPVGTVIVKHFEMEMTEGDPNSRRRLETRLLTRGANGNWLGFTYKWNAGETDADLLVSGESEDLTVNLAGGGSITWPYSYPSRTDCLRCHTSQSNFALGLATRQLNRDFDYGTVTDNELRALNHIDYFTTDIGAATQYGVYPALDDTTAPIETRVRAYLAVNCAQCHRPGGPTPVMLDFRFDTANASMNAIDIVPSEGTLGLANARIIASGSKERSVLWERIRRLDTTRMPPIGTHRVDQAAVDLLGNWIDNL